jgi:hypothetical protein
MVKQVNGCDQIEMILDKYQWLGGWSVSEASKVRSAKGEGSSL